MYYILTNDISSEFDSTLSEPTNLPREVNFISGSVITHQIETPLIFTSNAKSGDTMVDFSRGSITLMSRRFLELLQQFGVDNLQVFPAIVKSKEDETTWNDYFAVNVLGIVSCAVLSESTYSEIMKGHYIFSELAIDSSKGNDALLFRLQEHSPTIIIHREVIRHIIDNDPDENLLGWDFDDIIQ